MRSVLLYPLGLWGDQASNNLYKAVQTESGSQDNSRDSQGSWEMKRPFREGEVTLVECLLFGFIDRINMADPTQNPWRGEGVWLQVLEGGLLCLLLSAHFLTMSSVTQKCEQNQLQCLPSHSLKPAFLGSLSPAIVIQPLEAPPMLANFSTWILKSVGGKRRKKKP